MSSNKRPINAQSGLVYSTEHGRTCPACRQPIAKCVCKQQRTVPVGDGVMKVSRETKGRNGKSVTLVKGALLDAPALNALGKSLKAACGSGGTVKDGVIEIQGDHCEMVIEYLKKQGFKAKRAGG